MGSSHSFPTSAVSSNSDVNTNRTLPQADDFDTRWKRFIESLDISSLHVKHVESLDKQKKLELLLSFEAKDRQYPVSHYVNTLNHVDWGLLLNPRKRDSGCDLRALLLSTEVSLRTDSVGWVYEFLNCDGLEILYRFISICLEIILWPSDSSKRSTSRSDSFGSLTKQKSNCESHIVRGSSATYSLSLNGEIPSSVGKNGDQFVHEHPTCRFAPQKIVDALNNRIFADNARKIVPKGVNALLKECLHLSLRCLKTILNNQHGCKRAFDHPELLTVLIFCLFHPSYATKALVLDILTALCLIEGGHSRVLHSFDRLRYVMGEGLRFELLLDLFRQHEALDAELYNIDFPVACVQFFNIVVHCPENINLRVYLQHELFLLGLDDTLKKLRTHADDRLRQHVEAYLDNRVDCSILLEDAEAKEAAVVELERVEADLAHKINAVKEDTRAELENAFKIREMELSSLVESLRTRIRDLNVSSWDRENAIKHRMEELNQALKVSRTEVARLQTAVESIKSKSNGVRSGVPTNSMATSTNFETDVPASLDASTSQRKQPQYPVSAHNALRSNSFDHTSSPLSVQSTEGTLPSVVLVNDSNKCSTDPSGKQLNGPQKPSRKRLQLTSPSGDVQSDVSKLPLPIRDLPTVRQLALNATGTLSQLVHQTVCNDSSLSPNFMVPPIGWKPIHDCESAKDSIFDSAVLQKSMSLFPLKGVSERSPAALDDFWPTCTPHMTEPWSSAAHRCATVFIRAKDLCKAQDKDSTPSPFTWLVELHLVPAEVIQYSISIPNKPTILSITECDLFLRLTRLQLNCFVAQRLLHQMDAESQPTSPDLRSNLFDSLESAIEQKFVCPHAPVELYPTAAENHWFLTASFLHITLLRQLWPVELQRITESLSALLAGCMSILVNSKLPIIMRLVLECASRVTASWSVEGFQLQSLDSLLDWTLSGVATSAAPFQPPINGGPPAYSSDGIESEKGGKSSISFLQSFTLLVSRIAPNLLDWPGELCHLESASRISIPDIFNRIKLLETVCEVWRTLRSANDHFRELDAELGSTTVSQLSCEVIRNQLIQLHQAADSVNVVALSTAQWLLQLPVQTTLPSTSILPGWLAPLARFASAFERCASNLDRKHPVLTEPNAPVGTPHMREQRRRRNEPHASGGGKRDHRRKKHSTRQLDSDGIMDDILAGLTSQPLRADVHMKRTDSAPSNNPT